MPVLFCVLQQRCRVLSARLSWWVYPELIDINMTHWLVGWGSLPRQDLDMHCVTMICVDIVG